LEVIWDNELLAFQEKMLHCH